MHEGFKEYIEGGLREEKAKCYRCAVDLYYKAMCQLIDYLLKKEDIQITKLKDRLDNIQKLNSGLYAIFTTAHRIYRSAYKQNKDKKDCKGIKDGIKKIVLLKGVKGEFEKITKNL